MVIRGGCGFSSLMKQKKKGKITLSFASPYFFLKFFCYEVFAKQKKDKLADNQY